MNLTVKVKARFNRRFQMAARRASQVERKPDQRTLLEVQEYFGLPSPALVEKDWFVVRALAAIHDLKVDGLTLAFGGGTALGRAYRL